MSQVDRGAAVPACVRATIVNVNGRAARVVVHVVCMHACVQHRIRAIMVPEVPRVQRFNGHLECGARPVHIVRSYVAYTPGILLPG